MSRRRSPQKVWHFRVTERIRVKVRVNGYQVVLRVAKELVGMIGAEKYSAVKVISRGAVRIERPPTT